MDNFVFFFTAKIDVLSYSTRAGHFLFKWGGSLFILKIIAIVILYEVIIVHFIHRLLHSNVRFLAGQQSDLH